MQRLGHVPALNGIRGVAILAVIAYHFFGLPGGFFGVDVFFVLSGFLITTLLLEEYSRESRISLPNFYARRARRLMPALFALLFLTGLFAWIAPATAGVRFEGIAATLGYGANVIRMLGHPLPLELTQNWSLSQEEQFYLVWPALLILVLGLRTQVRRLAWLLLAAGFAVAVWRVALVASEGATGRVFFGPDTRSDGLLLGCSLAAAYSSGLLSLSRLERAAKLAPAALITLLAAFTMSAHALAYTVGFPLVEVCSALLIAACLTSRARILEWRPLVWLGAISYSLYLWEGPAALFFGHTLIGASIALMLGWLSYRFIEQPLRKPRRAPALQALPGPSR